MDDKQVFNYGYLNLIAALVVMSMVTMVSASLPVTLTFNGTQYMTISLPREVENEIEDISLKFRTEQTNGLLLMTSSNTTNDLLMVVLDGGRIRLDFKLNHRTETVWTGAGLDDNTWHVVRVRRRQKRLLLQVDEGETQKGKILHKVPVTLAVKDIHLGARADNAEGQDGRGYMEDVLPSHLGERPANYIGQMQSFVYNGHDYFQHSPDNIDTNADISQNNAPVSYDLTFKSPEAFITIQYNIKREFAMYFNFKTTQSDGLIFYSGNGNANDFLALELYDGDMRLIFDVGNGPQVIESNLSKRMSDNEWHAVSILRSNVIHFYLTVDETETTYTMQDGGQVDLDTSSTFYIGGASRDVFAYLPDKVKSREGYQGCLAEIDLELHDVYDYTPGGEHRDMVTRGCQGPKAVCAIDSCDNGGRCEQGWDTFTCDCGMTSYSGPSCDEESTSYRFEGRGLMTFTQPEEDWVDTRYDMLALGLRTSQGGDAVLVRVNSGDSDDSIQMEVVQGYIFVTYNMGTEDHPITDSFTLVNDSRYHVVRFTRHGPNSTLQIDNGDIQTKNPSGHQLKTFNKQAQVQVGGRKDKAGTNGKLFTGTITGLVLNKQPLLDYALAGDQRITIEGEVHPDHAPALTTPGTTTDAWTETGVLSTPPATPLTTHRLTTTTHRGEDLVSGMASGCGLEPGSDCMSDPDPDPSTRLVVPVTRIVKTTSSVRPMTTPPLPDYSGDKPCQGDDDEDCGSGSDLDTDLDPGQTPDLDPIDQLTVEPSSPDFDFTSLNTDDEHKPDVEIDVGLGRNKPEIISPEMTETPPHPRHHSTTTNNPSHKSTTQSQEGGYETKTDKDGNPDGADTSKVKDHHMSSLGVNIGLIIGIALGVVLLILILAFALYKYRGRGEGTGKTEENKQYRYESVSTKVPAAAVNGSNGVAKAQADCAKTNKKKGTVKEWYV